MDKITDNDLIPGEYYRLSILSNWSWFLRILFLIKSSMFAWQFILQFWQLHFIKFSLLNCLRLGYADLLKTLDYLWNHLLNDSMHFHFVCCFHLILKCSFWCLLLSFEFVITWLYSILEFIFNLCLNHFILIFLSLYLSLLFCF